MTSQYDTLLAEAKINASVLAKDYIPRMYYELVEVEKIEPHDAGERIRKDLVEVWSRDTIYTNLPEEAKHEGRGRPKKKDTEESIIPIETIVLEQSNSLLVGSVPEDNQDLERIRPQVFARDNSKCTVCGSTELLGVHHKESKDGIGSDHSMENLVTLCRSCHSRLHVKDKPRSQDGRFTEPEKHLGDMLEQYKERENSQKQDYDKLADEYNQVQETLEGLRTHNDYLEEEVKQLKQALQANLMAQATPAGKVQQAAARNPNRGYWIKFDLSNVEITRPLINIIMRMKDRPKQFYVEILGDDIIDVSETKQ